MCRKEADPFNVTPSANDVKHGDGIDDVGDSESDILSLSSSWGRSAIDDVTGLVASLRFSHAWSLMFDLSESEWRFSSIFSVSLFTLNLSARPATFSSETSSQDSLARFDGGSSFSSPPDLCSSASFDSGLGRACCRSRS